MMTMDIGEQRTSIGVLMLLLRKDGLYMIKELMNLIKSYLDGNTVKIPEGYQNITREYNFYNFLEDYLFDNWEDIATDETYDIVDELPELCAETEPYTDTTDMDIRLREYYDRLKEITPFI